MSPKYFRCQEHTLPCQHIRGNAQALATSQEESLSLAVRQYVPFNNENPRPGDVTFIAATGNGFPKEMYELLWDELYQYFERNGNPFRIRSVWIADIASQGASGLLNAWKLGCESESLGRTTIAEPSPNPCSVLG